MALGRRGDWQESLFVSTDDLATPGNPFNDMLNTVLAKHDFDKTCEDACAPHYTSGVGRPSLPPGVYFRLLLIGYFEKLPSDRRIAWRVADSLSLRSFLGLRLDQRTPDHSTISATRRRLDMKVHRELFAQVLTILAVEKLLKDKTLGVDATNLAANASMKNLRHKVSKESYRQYVKDLMRDDPDEPDDPSDEDIARYDRQRKGKKLSNAEWENPHNPDARIGRMKDGRSRFTEKCEHAVDLDTGAVIGLSIQPADRGDTSSLFRTLNAAAENLHATKDAILQAQKGLPGDRGLPPEHQHIAELIADKGYHSNETCKRLTGNTLNIRTYLSEPARGRRNWAGKAAEKAAVYANRRRIKGERGKRLMRRRGELLERPFANYLDHGGMRRVHLRGHANIEKRLLLHVAGYNLGLLMRNLLGSGTPRGHAAQKRGKIQQSPLLAALIRPYLAPIRTAHYRLARPLRHPLAA